TGVAAHGDEPVGDGTLLVTERETRPASARAAAVDARLLAVPDAVFAARGLAQAVDADVAVALDGPVRAPLRLARRAAPPAVDAGFGAVLDPVVARRNIDARPAGASGIGSRACAARCRRAADVIVSDLEARRARAERGHTEPERSEREQVERAARMKRD